MPNWCMNTLGVSGPENDIRMFRLAAEGPTQSYNEFQGTTGKWPVHDAIRLKSIAQTPPESGESTIFSFHALFPVPEEFRRFPYDCRRAKEIGELVGEERPYGGYSWENANWGCKWGASSPDLQAEEPRFLQYSFDTPWGPPEPFLQKISEDWPALSFELDYEEPGMDFAGTLVCEEGQIVSHEERSCESEDDYDDDYLEEDEE